jgi:hypothetical protein
VSFQDGHDAALAAYGIKEALHALDRLQERTDLDPNVISTLQAQADTLDLPEGHYYMPLKSPTGVHAGYAAFKTVPAWPKPKLVLATVLGPEMHPKGSNISHLMNPSHSQDTAYQAPDLTKAADFDTDAYNGALSPQQRGALRRRFDYLTHTLHRKGVETGTSHKRIVIPKDKFTENDILGMGFEPVTIAIPEAGQDQFSSYRHPDNTFHIHSHPEGWTMHEDRHPASTMIAKHESTVLGKAKALVQGMPHLVTEGIPGLGYYLKGQIGGTTSTAQNVLEDINPEVRRRLEHLKPSPTYEEKTAMDKNAYGEGQQSALTQYGAPEGWKPEDEQEQEQQPLLARRKSAPAPAAKSHTPWWPAALAATAAGVGMYKHMRTPSLAKNNPYLARLQQNASEKGFHNIVDVSSVPNTFKWKNKQPWYVNAAQWANEKMRPQVNDRGELDLADKLKLWALHGSEAVPVASSPGRGKGNIWIPGHEGPMNVKGVVMNRNTAPEHSWHEMSKMVRGGRDLEGSANTQRALTALGRGGKANEYALFDKHLPDIMPETQGDLTKYLPPNHEKYLRTDAGKVQLVRIMKQNMRKDFGTEGGKDFLLKPDQGFASGGEMPFGRDKWGKTLRGYLDHMQKPKNRAAWDKAQADGPYAEMEYLRDNGLYEGHTLHQAVTKPRGSTVLQREIPGFENEFRVHVIGGSAPKSLITPRHSEDTMDALKTPYSDLQSFAENAVRDMPKKHRRGILGLDVGVGRDPATGRRIFKIIESNPSELANRRIGEPGGGSGFLTTDQIPWAGHSLYRHATGRHTTPAALGAAGLTAGGVGLGARLLTPETPDDENKDAPHPAG